MRRAFGIKKIKRIKTIPILVNQRVGFQKDIIELPDGTRREYYLTNRGKKSAFILPVDARGRILLLREYRYPLQKVIIGPVGGEVDPGETPLQGAKRELMEETGYQARSVRLLGTFYASPANSDTFFYTYIATRLTPGTNQLDQGEYLQPVWYTRAEVRRMIRTRQIKDPYLLASLLLYFQG
ncbi:MAG: NUDIX hydrolase [Candidatus Kerfeldbacteria bacterium]|nr:NUDIX hydrolase [Candidatus Kerfeldbacteria bacterium]